MDIMELKSEFADVKVEVDHSANGPRLMIQDLKSGMTNYLDPLELECLAWARHEDLTLLLDPSHEFRHDSDDLQLQKMLREIGSVQES